MLLHVKQWICTEKKSLRKWVGEAHFNKLKKKTKTKNPTQPKYYSICKTHAVTLWDASIRQLIPFMIPSHLPATLWVSMGVLVKQGLQSVNFLICSESLLWFLHHLRLSAWISLFISKSQRFKKEFFPFWVRVWTTRGRHTHTPEGQHWEGTFNTECSLRFDLNWCFSKTNQQTNIPLKLTVFIFCLLFLDIYHCH